MAIQILGCVIGFNGPEIHKYVIEKYVSPHYGAKIGEPLYDPRADIDNDGIIGLADLTQFTRDPQLTFKTFGVTPLLWYSVVIPLALGFVGVAALAVLKKR